MFVREAKELSHASASVELGNLVTILQSWFKDKDRTSPDMRPNEVAVVALGLGDHL